MLFSPSSLQPCILLHILTVSDAPPYTVQWLPLFVQPEHITMLLLPWGMSRTHTCRGTQYTVTGWHLHTSQSQWSSYQLNLLHLSLLLVSLEVLVTQQVTYYMNTYHSLLVCPCKALLKLFLSLLVVEQLVTNYRQW